MAFQVAKKAMETLTRIFFMTITPPTMMGCGFALFANRKSSVFHASASNFFISSCFQMKSSHLLSRLRIFAGSSRRVKMATWSKLDYISLKNLALKTPNYRA